MAFLIKASGRSSAAKRDFRPTAFGQTDELAQATNLEGLKPGESSRQRRSCFVLSLVYVNLPLKIALGFEFFIELLSELRGDLLNRLPYKRRKNVIDP